MTIRLYKSIQLQGLNERFTEIAERYGISNMTVRRAVDDFIEENDKKRILIAPRVIGIDEAHLNKAMRAVITNINKREIIDILPTNTKRDVKAFIKSLEGYKDIEVATHDYIIDTDDTGKPYPKSEQVARCGNSVSPVIPKALVEANLPELCGTRGDGMERANKARSM